MRMLTCFLLIGLAHIAAARDYRTETVDVTAKPKFVKQDRFVDLAISDTNHSFDIGWGMPPDVWFIPVSLDTNQIYTFTIAQRPFRDITIPELQRVMLNGQAIYNIEVCETHKIKMEYKEVPIFYGLIVPATNEPSGEIERQLFPHRSEYSLGGCVVEPDSPKTEHVYVCADCKKAYDKWKAEHKIAK